jgi:hypothetical protein
VPLEDDLAPFDNRRDEIGRGPVGDLAVPGSIVPIWSPSPRANAALTVTAASASEGLSLSARQATVITSGRLVVGEVPGLKSVARAIGMPRSINVRAGANVSCIRNQVVAGRSVATTG